MTCMYLAASLVSPYLNSSRGIHSYRITRRKRAPLSIIKWKPRSSLTQVVLVAPFPHVIRSQDIMSRSTLALLTVALFLSSVFPGFAHARWFQRNVHQTRTIAEIPNTTGVVYVLLVDGEEVTTTTITASETSYVTVPVYANSTAPVNATSVPTSVSATCLFQ
jgi:hypothetical protein